MTRTAAITAQHLTKRYGRLQAVSDLTFEIDRGELFGIIGPDGAGKTSLFRILTTLLLADEGRATVDGLDVVRDFKSIRQRIGYMPGKFSLYQDLTIAENLNFFAAVFRTTVEANYHLIKDIYRQIEPFRDRRAGQLSGGMKQKLALCCALIHKPSVLFLDEPTTGVDPVSRKELWDMLIGLRDQGLTIVVSTPYMDEATLCSRIALMQEGRFLQTDSPAAIVAAFPDRLWAVRTRAMHRLLNDLRACPEVKTAYSFGEYLHVTLHTDASLDAHLRPYLRQQGHADAEIKAITPTVEDCFMRLTTND